jgi:hypothetical protein
VSVDPDRRNKKYGTRNNVTRRRIETVTPDVSPLQQTLGQEISKCSETELLPNELLIGRGGGYWMCDPLDAELHLVALHHAEQSITAQALLTHAAS